MPNFPTDIDRTDTVRNPGPGPSIFQEAVKSNPMEPDFDTLLEQVLAAVMDGQAEPITLLWSLRQATGNPRITTLIRAFLAADKIISSTFNGDGQDRSDAGLARTMALILAEAADDVEVEAETAQIPARALRLSDLSI